MDEVTALLTATPYMSHWTKDPDVRAFPSNISADVVLTQGKHQFLTDNKWWFITSLDVTLVQFVVDTIGITRIYMRTTPANSPWAGNFSSVGIERYNDALGVTRSTPPSMTVISTVQIDSPGVLTLVDWNTLIYSYMWQSPAMNMNGMNNNNPYQMSWFILIRGETAPPTLPPTATVGPQIHTPIPATQTLAQYVAKAVNGQGQLFDDQVNLLKAPTDWSYMYGWWKSWGGSYVLDRAGKCFYLTDVNPNVIEAEGHFDTNSVNLDDAGVTYQVAEVDPNTMLLYNKDKKPIVHFQYVYYYVLTRASITPPASFLIPTPPAPVPTVPSSTYIPTLSPTMAPTPAGAQLRCSGNTLSNSTGSWCESGSPLNASCRDHSNCISNICIDRKCVQYYPTNAPTTSPPPSCPGGFGYTQTMQGNSLGCCAHGTEYLLYDGNGTSYIAPPNAVIPPGTPAWCKEAGAGDNCKSGFGIVADATGGHTICCPDSYVYIVTDDAGNSSATTDRSQVPAGSPTYCTGIATGKNCIVNAQCSSEICTNGICR